MGSEPTLPETVRAAELAALLGVSPPTLSHLATAGRVVKRGGRYALAESVRAYCDHLRSPAARAGRRADSEHDPLKAERIRLTREQADRAAAANAANRGELLPASEVERTWAETLRRLRSELLALPGRIGGRLGHLSRHDLSEMDHEIRAVLTELAGCADDPAPR